MIEFVEGRLVEKSPACAVVQVGGIAFQILIPLSSYDALPETGREVKLYSLLVVREDSLTLFGFVKLRERQLFEKLTQVSGIGPKLAITALSGLPPADLQNAIVEGDVKRLSSISGIGKKMAERMVVELRDKLQADGGAISTGAGTASGPYRDAVLALVALGYKQQEAAAMLDPLRKSLPDAGGHSVAELVRLALSRK